MATVKSSFKSNRVALEGMTDEAARLILTDIATQGESYAKQNVINNDTVDTGFMMNSIHAIPPSTPGPPGEKTTMTDRDGNKVDRESIALPDMDADTAAIGCGANYAIYMELDHPFLGPAGDQVQGNVAGFIAKHKI